MMDPESDSRESEQTPGRKNLLQELTRRHVVRVALLYFAVAWTVTEVISFLFDAIPIFPDWSKTLVALLFVLGFPVAMFLAWRFDIGPGGIQKTEAATKRGKLTVAVALILLIGSTAGLFYLIYPKVQDQADQAAGTFFDPPENSIAVMSFQNIGGGTENEYFSQGVPDSILHKLANLKNLIVIARTSSFAFSDEGMDASTIGRELNVRYILEGSVQRVGDNLRIITQLISTPDASHVWSLDRRLIFDDIFSLQDEVALEITKALQLTLQEEERDRLLAHGTDSVPAYLAYLRGDYAQQSRSLERLDEALKHYEEAIALDPTYARAYVGIARTYGFMGTYGSIDRAEGDALYRQFLEKALEYDDKLGEAYASLMFLSGESFDAETSKALLEKAMALSPNDAHVLRARARALCAEDFYGFSCNKKKAGLQLEAIRRSPEDPTFYFDMAWTMLGLGRPDEARKYFSEAVRRNPDMTTGYTRLGRLYHWFGRDTVRGVACLREAIARDPQNAFPKTELALTYIDLGLDDLAERLLDEARDSPGRWDEFYSYVRLTLHVYRHEQDQAVEIAKRYYEEIANGTQIEIASAVLIEDARNSGDFSWVVQVLESIIEEDGRLDNYEDVELETPPGLNAALSLIRVYELTGDSGRAAALKAAVEAFLQRAVRNLPLMRPGLADRLARAHLWRGEVDKALDELERIPGAFMRNPWHLNRNAAFQELHGHPRFQAIIDALQSQADADRTRLETLGDDLPPCVTNMRANAQ